MKFIFSIFLCLFFASVGLGQANHSTDDKQATEWLYLVKDYQYKNNNPDLALLVWAAGYLGENKDIDGAMKLCYMSYLVAIKLGEDESAYVIANSYLLYEKYKKENDETSLFNPKPVTGDKTPILFGK